MPGPGLFKFASEVARRAASRALRGTADIVRGAKKAAQRYGGTFQRVLSMPRRDVAAAVRDLAQRQAQDLSRRIPPVQQSGSVVPPPIQTAPPNIPPSPPKQEEPRESPVLQQLRQLARDIARRSSISPSDAQDLLEKLVALLRVAERDPTVPLATRDAFTNIAEILAKRMTPPDRPGQRQTARDQEDDIEVMGEADIGGWPDAADFVAEERLTPASSNVYSYFWRRKGGREGLSKTGHPRGSDMGTMFVTFKLWHPGMKGKRPNRAGPSYAYSNCRFPSTRLSSRWRLDPLAARCGNTCGCAGPGPDTSTRTDWLLVDWFPVAASTFPARRPGAGTRNGP